MKLGWGKGHCKWGYEQCHPESETVAKQRLEMEAVRKQQLASEAVLERQRLKLEEIGGLGNKHE